MSNNKPIYEVGYKKPPTSGKFKKGKSGNPSGRPKGSKNFTTFLDIEMNEVIGVTEHGEHKRIPRCHASAKQFANKAVMGDIKMLPILLNRDKENERPKGVEAAPISSKDKLVMSSIVERIQQMRLPTQTAHPEDSQDLGASSNIQDPLSTSGASDTPDATDTPSKE